MTREDATLRGTSKGLWGGICLVVVVVGVSALVGCGEAGSNPQAQGAGGKMGSGGAFATGGARTSGGSMSAEGAAAGALGAGARRSTLPPPDDRPLPPPWQPGIPLGTPGWEGSDEPFCDNQQGNYQSAFGVWADARGVFTLVDVDCGAFAGAGGTPCGKAGTALQFNDGTGWKIQLVDLERSAAMLSAFPGGPAILLRYGPPTSTLGSISFVNEGNLFVQTALLPEGTTATAAFGVGSDRAFILAQESFDPSTAAVHEVSNGVFRKVGTLPVSARAIWADEDNILVAGDDQSIYLRRSSDADFTLLPDVPAGNYWSLWAFGANDVWAGNTAGQLVHYDGAAWTVLETSTQDGIRRLWGSEGEVYFSSGTEFGRSDGTSVESFILSAPGISVSDIWGRSRNEVFLAVSDSAFASYRCGEGFALWFDGSLFHRF